MTVAAIRASWPVVLPALLILVAGNPHSLLAEDLYFPGSSWETVTPEAAGYDAKKLNETLDFAMSFHSSSVVILWNGRILAQRHTQLTDGSQIYQQTVAGETPEGQVIEDVASAQKSIVSVLMGIAVEKKLLRLDDPVDQHLGAGWSKANPDQESQVTIRHLITMTSGLSNNLSYSDPPGTRWAYNTNGYAKSLQCIEAASGMSASELTSAWLLDKTGMKHSGWKDRSWASAAADANRLGFITTALDLARFGLLIQAGGKWNEQVVVGDQDYLRASLSPSQELNPSYGYLWWLNGQSHTFRGQRRIESPLLKSAPDDTVAALGALGRTCFICPSLHLVVTRLGDAPGSPDFNEQFWQRLTAASANDGK